MSIFGIGIDLCEIQRVEDSLDKLGERFADKILAPQEKKTYLSHKFKGRFLAKRFAAKEAFAKALGTGISEGVTLPDIEVTNDPKGKPEIRLHGEASNKVNLIAGASIHLSISDEKHYAIAQVIIESNL